MIITDAVWEKRNLQLRSVEITVEQKDDPCVSEDTLREVRGEYLVVKTPVGIPQWSSLLSELGFFYIESMVHVRHGLERPALSEEKRSLLERITMHKADASEAESVLDHIRQGLFHTDRVSLDPYFPKGMAGQRYAGWLQDERKRGSDLWLFSLDDNPYGFCCARQESDGSCRDVLNGIYPAFQGRGLSFAFTHKLLEAYRSDRFSGLVSDVSTNNTPSLQRFLRSGYWVEGMTNIFVRHDLPREQYLARLNGAGLEATTSE